MRTKQTKQNKMKKTTKQQQKQQKQQQKIKKLVLVPCFLGKCYHAFYCSYDDIYK